MVRTLALIAVVGLLAAALPFQALSQIPPAPLFELVDEEEDVHARDSEAPVPTSISGAIDLRSFHVAYEDGTKIVLRLNVVDLESFWTVRPSTQTGLNLVVEFAWKAEPGDIRYRLTGGLGGDTLGAPGPAAPPAHQDLRPTLCLRSGGSEYDCIPQEVAGRAIPAEDHYELEVPKLSLLGQKPTSRDFQGRPRPLPASLPDSLETGSQIAFTTIRVESVAFVDEIAIPAGPNQDSFFTTKPTANTRIRLGLAEPPPPEPRTYWGQTSASSPPSVGIVPGVPSLVGIKLENHAHSRRLVNLTAQFKDPQQASRWDVQIPPTLDVPRNDSRIVNMVVNASEDVQHRDEVFLHVRGESLGYPDETAEFLLSLKASVPPGPEAKTLHLHARSDNAPRFPVFASGGASRWLNTLEEDELADLDEDGVQAQQWEGGGFMLDTPLGRDLILDANQPATGMLVMQSRVPVPITARISLSAGNEFVLGEVAVDKEIQGTKTEVPFSIPLDPKETRVRPSDGRLLLSISVQKHDNAGGATTFVNEVLLIPKGSHVDLPAIPDPLERIIVGPRTFGVYPENDTSDWLNPGRTALFEAVIVNEGTQADRASVEARSAATGWITEIRPAAQYDLKLGQSVRIGLLIRAPHDAAEGEQGRVELRVRSEADPRALSVLEFIAIATRGLDIPDEAPNYHPDEDALQLAHRASENAPASGLLAAFASLFMAALASSRRRR